MLRFRIIQSFLLFSLVILLAGYAEAITSAHWLWLDDENTYQCDDPFVSEELTCWLTPTTVEDCGDVGACNFYWSEGVIGLNQARLMVDLSFFSAIDSMEVYYWDTTQDDLRVFLYFQDEIVEEVHGEFYGEMLTIRTEGQPVDLLAVSACGGELYEIAIYGAEGTSSVPAQSTMNFRSPYPNPANPRCTFAFELSHPASILLEIFSLSGRLVRTLAQGEWVAAGTHQRVWDGVDNQGFAVASGVYLVQMKLEDEVKRHPLVLIK